MRVAIFLSGMPRTFTKTKDAFWDMIGTQEVDTYVQAWDTFDEGYNRYEGERKLAEVYRPRRIKMMSWASHVEQLTQDAEPLASITFPRKNFNVLTGIFGQYFSIRQAFDLIPDADEYDLILRCRFDWYPLFKMDWEALMRRASSSGLCSSDFKVKGLPQEGYALNDLFIAGTPEHMRTYVGFNEAIRGEDIRGAARNFGCGVPEFLLCWYLIQQQVPISKYEFPYALVLPRFAKALRKQFGANFI